MSKTPKLRKYKKLEEWRIRFRNKTKMKQRVERKKITRKSLGQKESGQIEQGQMNRGPQLGRTEVLK